MYTKQDFVDMVRAVGAAKGDEELEHALMVLSDDLGFIQLLVKAFPEEALAQFEAEGAAPLWDEEDDEDDDEDDEDDEESESEGEDKPTSSTP